MSALGKMIVEVALAEVGVREVGGNNLGPRVKEYQSATWLPPGPWPWCAAFTAWVLKESLRRLNNTAIAHCPDASAYGWEKWAAKHGWLVLPETAAAQAGDFVTFDFSHIGIVEADFGTYIATIEGNTNGRGQRDSESGDGVWRKERMRPLVKSFIRVQQ